MSGATSTKPGGKLERDRLCQEMLAKGRTRDQVADEMMRRWSFRPRQAWRHAHKLHDPDGRAKWLAAIARNVCLRWGRRRGKELARRSATLPDEDMPGLGFEDWLADDFMAHGWRLKRLHKLIVTSATYRQSSQVAPATLAKDPRSRLLAYPAGGQNGYWLAPARFGRRPGNSRSLHGTVAPSHASGGSIR